jgi:hypothetical protein
MFAQALAEGHASDDRWYQRVSSHAAVSSQVSGSSGLDSPFHFPILIPIIGQDPFMGQAPIGVGMSSPRRKQPRADL